MIQTLILLDVRAHDIAAHIRMARPDIECRFGVDAELPETPFAVAAFAPGLQVNRFRRAQWVHCTGAGTDKLLRAMDFAPPIMTRTVGQMGSQLAEYVLAYILSDSQLLDARRRAQAAGEWAQEVTRPRFLAGQKALFFGTGELAQTIAARLGVFGMKCHGISRRGLLASGFEQTARLDRLEDLQPETADFVILALPNLDGMEKLIGDEILSRFEGALLLNIGRGEVLDHRALLSALEKTHIRHAVLDVFPEEPLPSSSALWGHPQLTITPHIAAQTRPEDAAEAFLAALDALENDREPPHRVLC